MKITKLKYTKKGDRVNVYIDKKYAFSVGKNLITDHSLFCGKKLSRKQIQQIKTDDIIEKNFFNCIRLLTRRPRSEFEIRTYISKKLYKSKNKDKISNAIILRLKRKDLVDDPSFAKWWVKNRKQFKPRGKYLLIQELKSKGIQNPDIKKALHEAGFDRSYEIKAAEKVAGKKIRLLGNLKDKKNKERFLRYLLSRGFDYSIARDTLERVLSNKSII